MKNITNRKNNQVGEWQEKKKARSLSSSLACSFPLPFTSTFRTAAQRGRQTYCHGPLSIGQTRQLALRCLRSGINLHPPCSSTHRRPLTVTLATSPCAASSIPSVGFDPYRHLAKSVVLYFIKNPLWVYGEDCVCHWCKLLLRWPPAWPADAEKFKSNNVWGAWDGLVKTKKPGVDYWEHLPLQYIYISWYIGLRIYQCITNILVMYWVKAQRASAEGALARPLLRA